MSRMKLGSKTDAFTRQGQAWFCSTGLPSDVTVEVEEMVFHLHKFPLLSRSGLLARLIVNEDDDRGHVRLVALPGGAAAFELAAKFCYGMELELTAANVVGLRCAAEHLEMTEELGESNLVAQTEFFLDQVVLRRWKEALVALRSCERLMPLADDLNIVRRCVDLMAAIAADSSLLWNGISSAGPDWWSEDACTLSIPFFKRLASEMQSQGVRREALTSSLVFYAQKHLPGLSRRHSTTIVAVSELEQRLLVEEIEAMLPLKKDAVSTGFLAGLLRTGMILGVSAACKSGLERRMGMQLGQAALEDIIFPSLSHTMESLYDVDCVQRMIGYFLADQAGACGSPCLAPLAAVARLIDAFLAEVAGDPNLKLAEFQALAASVPEYSRPLVDGLYRAIDVYLKAHPWLGQAEREQLCQGMDCQKLTLEACAHAAQNERLPLRVVVRVLFFEQLQLKSSIASCFLSSESLDGSRTLGGRASAERENQVLRVGMDSMRLRVLELEKECSTIKEELKKLGRNRTGGSAVAVVRRKLGLKIKSEMCSTREGSVDERVSLLGRARGTISKK